MQLRRFMGRLCQVDVFKWFALSLMLIGLAGCLATSQKVSVIELHNRKPVELNTQLHVLESKKSPTVILLHGCNGPDSIHMNKWATQLNAWGYNAVIVDSISSRGAKQICNKPILIATPEQRSKDAYDVAKWIQLQPWATQKVGVVGFSHGGSAVIYSAATSYVERNFGTQVISAGVALYPGCDQYLISDKPAIPIQMHTAGRDQWTLASLCKNLARGWKTESEFFFYENATHGFDTGFTGSALPDVNGTRHWIEFNPLVTEQAMRESKRFLDANLR